MTGNDYRASHLGPAHAEQYAHSFADETTYRGMVWRLEKDILTKSIAAAPWRDHIEHLDFACGSGRILEHLRPYTADRTGVDVSPAMLQYARASNTDADILEVDLTKDNVLRGRKFNLITAFRFFPNAQPDLRSDVMHVLSDLLSDDGYLIFNNHLNLGSVHNRLRRITGRDGHKGMSMAEARALIAEAGLEVIAVRHLCVILTAEEYSPLPVSLLLPIEKAMSRIRFVRGVAGEHVFLCRHGRV